MAGLTLSPLDCSYRRSTVSEPATGYGDGGAGQDRLCIPLEDWNYHWP